MKSCILCGVGGQGTVLASRIIAQAAMEKGMFARTAETIGMAQRGGCVVSHVRFGNDIPSPMIPKGKADVLIGFEPGETVRNLPYLRKNGVVVMCSREIQPVTASLSGECYNGETFVEYVRKTVNQCFVVDADKIISECGSVKALNVALVGAAVKSGALGITIEDVEKILETKVKREYLAVNKAALALGAGII